MKKIIIAPVIGSELNKLDGEPWDQAVAVFCGDAESARPR
jgi:hypothetical protein